MTPLERITKALKEISDIPRPRLRKALECALEELSDKHYCVPEHPCTVCDGIKEIADILTGEGEEGK